VRLAERFHTLVIRVPYERSLADLPMFVWAHHDRRLAASRGIFTPQFVGRAMTGVMTQETLSRAIRRLRPGHNQRPCSFGAMRSRCQRQAAFSSIDGH
jgi:hypothetical protein